MPCGTSFQCRSCGHQSAFTLGFLFYRNDAGENIPLAHPGEDDDLAALGVDWDQAVKQRRLYISDDWACRDCGEYFDHKFIRAPRHRIDPSFAFFIALMASMVIFFGGQFWNPFPSLSEGAWFGLRTLFIVVGWILLIAAVIALRAIDVRLTTRAYRAEIAAESPAHCPACRGPNLLHAMSALRPTDPPSHTPPKCPKCHHPTLDPKETWIA